jgi:hypothetical protein
MHERIQSSHERVQGGRGRTQVRCGHTSVQKMVVILGHPLTATLPAWLIELKGQRSARGGQKYPSLSVVLGGSPFV